MGLGDDLMITGEVKLLASTIKRKIAVKMERNRQRWSEVFINNPHMATVEEVKAGAHVHWLGVNAGRRYRASETKEKRVWTTVGPTAGELYFTDEEADYGKKISDEIGKDAVIIEPNLKQIATVNKDWGWPKWEKLVSIAPNVNWVQIAKKEYKKLPGVKHISPPSFRHAASLIANISLCVLPEGGLHHAAAAVNKKAVVIFGGYISPVQTGYPIHVNIFTGGVPCGMKIRCTHCTSAMNKIAPEMIRDWVYSLKDTK